MQATPITMNSAKLARTLSPGEDRVDAQDFTLVLLFISELLTGRVAEDRKRPVHPPFHEIGSRSTAWRGILAQ